MSKNGFHTDSDSDKLCLEIPVTAKEFHRLVTGDKSDFLDRFLEILRELDVPYCVIGGLAVNAYTEPVVTLDCDVVVPTSRLAELEQTLRACFRVERFEHSLNISDKGSDVRIQIQTDERSQEFLTRCRTANVLGRSLPVASPEDLIVSKVAAYQERTRRGSKRLKDLADIKRLMETFPELQQNVPPEIQQRMKL